MPYALLGDTCSDPTGYGCTQGMSNDPSGSGFDINNLLNTVLNDVTQIIKPDTPQLRPIYTPTSSAVSSLFGNPMLWLAVGAGVYVLSRKR